MSGVNASEQLAAQLAASVHEDRERIVAILYFFYRIGLPLICAFGILGNVANMLTLHSPALQAVSYMYLRALAVADLLCMVFVLEFVFRQANVFDDSYRTAFYAAYLELPLINFFIAAGVLTVVALTLERYISVVWPIHFRGWNTSRRAMSAICIAYLSSFVLYVPMCIKKTVVCSDHEALLRNWSNCSLYRHLDNKLVIERTDYEVYSWCREFAVRIAPIIAVAYFNMHIVIQLRRVHLVRRRMLLKTAKKQQSDSRNDGRLLVLLMAIVVLFFVCNVPAAINLVFIKDEFQDNWTYQLFRASANLLEISNHALNFYIFCMCSRDYRNEFINTFPCFFKQMQRRTVKFRSEMISDQSRCISIANHTTLDDTSSKKFTKDSLLPKMSLVNIAESAIENDKLLIADCKMKPKLNDNSNHVLITADSKTELVLVHSNSYLEEHSLSEEIL